MKDLSQFPVQVRFPVAWGEMDAFCHVNNVHYFNYFQKALTRYFHEIGILELRVKKGIAPVMAESKCKYLQSLKYPDNLVVGAKVTSVGQTSFVVEYIIVSEKSGVAAVGEGVMVLYDFNASRKTNIPTEIRNRIKMLESSCSA